MRRIYILAINLLVFCGMTAKAQTAAFLGINPDARTTSMSLDGISLEAGSWSFFQNTAAASLSEEKGEVGLSYSYWQPDATSNNMISAGGYGRIGKRFAITAGLKYFGYPEQSRYDGSAAPSGTVKPLEMAVGAGLGVKILPWLAAGANLGYVFSDMGGPKKGGAFSSDISLAADTKYLKVGLAVRNLGTKISYGYNSELLPMNAVIGLSSSHNFGKHRVEGGLEGAVLFETGSYYAGIGAGYTFNDWLRVSAGWRYGNGAQAPASALSAGLGFKVAGFSLNLAYLNGLKDGSAINNSLQIGLNYSF
ncbi:MAG: PorV/PorQ family protein [Candidatus Cryptobacteroides sp.]